MPSDALKIVLRQKQQENNLLPADLHPVLRQVLASRGVDCADRMSLDMSAMLGPEDLSQVQAAADMLADALAAGSHIRVVGDFDADGATGTALAVRALRAFGHDRVDYAVPNRFEFGYGLTAGLVATFSTAPPDLILTVDSGISSLEGVEKAKAMGCQVIVTDHHLPGEQLPVADAIVNPNVPGDSFPSKSLAGVGVMFYLMIALRQTLQRRDWFTNTTVPNLANLLDLVALGTVADLVPLDHNNRVLVQQGLKRIRQGRSCPGIQALLRVGRREAQQVVSSDLGFVVGPRLNAAGRLEDMTVGIRCLLTDDENEAQALAEWLDTLNRERQALQSDMEAQAKQIVSQQLALWQSDSTEQAIDVSHTLSAESGLMQDLFEKPDAYQSAEIDSGDNKHAVQQHKDVPLGLCIFQQDWHQGVVGLVASKIKDAVHRPVIAFAPESDTSSVLKGSARSIPGVHIRDVLAHVDAMHPGLMIAFGGHAMAAGLSMQLDQLENFRHAFCNSLAQLVDANVLQRQIEVDGTLRQGDINLDLAMLLRDAMPWGQQFPEPLFRGQFRVLGQRVVGASHLQLQLLPVHEGIDSEGDATPAIAFNTEPEQIKGDTVELLYRLSVNYFRGAHCQIVVEHILSR